MSANNNSKYQKKFRLKDKWVWCMGKVGVGGSEGNGKEGPSLNHNS